MRKSLFGFVQLIAVLFVGLSASAQAIDVLGPRLYVNNPSNIQGIKRFTYSYDGSQPWGRDLDTTYVNVPVLRVTNSANNDSLACSGITTIFDANQWALINRGNCEFGAKALTAQQKGAKGVIIVNNLPNAPLVNMGAGGQGGNVTIPVLFISKEDGDAITNALSSGIQVRISITRWGFGNNHDLAIVPYSAILPPYGAIPLSQAGYSDVPAYRNYTGAFVANTGNSNETNIKLKSVTTWTPTSGSASVVHTDSVTLAQLNLIDSFEVVNSTTPYYTPATTTGTFTTNYTLTAAATDSFMYDNSSSTSSVVTLNTFSKARYNTAKGEPMISGSTRFASGQAFTWGPLFYVRKGGYQMQTIQYAINDDDTSVHSLVNLSPSSAFIFKWKDGSVDNVKDSIMEAPEMTLVGTAGHIFTTADSNNKIFTSVVYDNSGNPVPVITEDSSYYWVAIPLPSGSSSSAMRLGVDNDLNYFYRSYIASNATPKSWDYYAPMFVGSEADIQSGSMTDTMMNFPFIAASDSKNPGVLSYFINQTGVVPAVALNISQFTTSVKNIPSSVSSITVYPTPATSGVINVRLGKGAGDYRYMTILDGVGRIVSSGDVNYSEGNTYSISTSKLASGHYYMNLVNSNGNFTVQQFDVIGK